MILVIDVGHHRAPLILVTSVRRVVPLRSSFPLSLNLILNRNEEEKVRFVNLVVAVQVYLCENHTFCVLFVQISQSTHSLHPTLQLFIDSSLLFLSIFLNFIVFFYVIFLICIISTFSFDLNRVSNLTGVKIELVGLSQVIFQRNPTQFHAT